MSNDVFTDATKMSGNRTDDDAIVVMDNVYKRFKDFEALKGVNFKVGTQEGVVVIGPSGSGKSTLINEFLGADIQAIGQAPTDDSFTIITYGDAADDNEEIQVTQERDGKFLLNDPDYPFEILKKHGQRFAAHFRLKKINDPFGITLIFKSRFMNDGFIFTYRLKTTIQVKGIVIRIVI
jgi:energy-coupling factor transporter ATP-binding protein EcfA2